MCVVQYTCQGLIGKQTGPQRLKQTVSRVEIEGSPNAESSVHTPARVSITGLRVQDAVGFRP